MKAYFCRWVGANLTILTNAGSLVGAMAVTSGLGFVYWLRAPFRRQLWALLLRPFPPCCCLVTWACWVWAPC
jgi:hypothetical protein